ncbi:MAG: A/G-specific adenine glycosylase [Burkholderiales bacterium]|nr:A/G-specific adenine glycosylase [Phycisphaerae bacterium]
MATINANIAIVEIKYKVTKSDENFAATLSRRLLRWYAASRRDLPWRIPLGSARAASPPAYHVLVSEAMLQQTQVATVVPYFQRFIARFPTITALADADEQDVLRHWQGLGYYTRARNLREAARAIVDRFGGRVPDNVPDLLTLPGVGRYTAGAIASLAYGTRAPILDGNVMRVLCRLDAIRTDPRQRVTTELLWVRAAEVLPARRVGDFNSAMMELGATICTPRDPKCLICPARPLCKAAALGIAETIPPPKKKIATPTARRRVLCVRRKDGAYLIEQRPPTGRWAGMWQFITVDADTQPPSGVNDPIATIRHALTHRKYVFEVHRAARSTIPPATPGRRWATFDQMDALPFSRPHLQIRKLLREEDLASGA